MTGATICSGIGAPETAAPEIDWIRSAEIDPFPSAVLAQRFGHPNLGNVMAPDFVDRALAIGRPDVLVAVCGRSVTIATASTTASVRCECGVLLEMQWRGECVRTPEPRTITEAMER